jgi:methyl-accepting chemotaxis protein
MVIEYEYYSEITHELINSIMDTINRTSNPLSEEILTIKQDISEFVNNMIGWKDELSDEASNKNFSNILKKYDTQNFEFKKVTEIITNSYQNLEKNLVGIVDMIEKIYENSFNIHGISEKIKILSINAAIESARSGKSGQGFSVISNEIKKLSNSTQVIITDIMALIGNAKNATKKTIDLFGVEVKNIREKFDFQKNGFEEFYGTLTNYYNDFISLFSNISNLSERISTHINKFSPIFQLHDISIQSLENIKFMNRQFLDDNHTEMSKIINTINDTRKNEILNSILDIVEDKVTTDPEIEVINKICDIYNLDRKINAFKKNEIEIF